MCLHVSHDSTEPSCAPHTHSRVCKGREAQCYAPLASLSSSHDMAPTIEGDRPGRGRSGWTTAERMKDERRINSEGKESTIMGLVKAWPNNIGALKATTKRCWNHVGQEGEGHSTFGLSCHIWPGLVLIGYSRAEDTV